MGDSHVRRCEACTDDLLEKNMAKSVDKWIAWLHNGKNKRVMTAKIQVQETAKQFRVTRGQFDKFDGPSWSALDYRSVHRKEDKPLLFDTELEALQALDERLTEVEQRATAKANDAQENLFLINEALENHGKTIEG